MKVEASNRVVINAKMTVRFIKSSGAAMEKLKNNETYLELPSLNVIQDVITR